MKQISRQKFLLNIWTRYPELPKQVLVYGVVQEIIQDNNKRICLKIDGKLFDLLLSEQICPDLEFCETNDIVAIDNKGQMILLAPCLGPAQMSVDLDLQQKWNLFHRNLRNFFENQNFIEVQTPSLVSCPGSEPSLEVFETEFEWGSLKRKIFLPTSPELSIKKFLAHAVRQKPNLKVFEIAKVFRNNEITERHHPEFFMLEWYRCFQDLDSIREDILNLLKALTGKSDFKVQQNTMKELFLEHVNFNLTPKTSAKELQMLATKLDIDTRDIQNFDDLFNLIFIEKIEFKWPKENLFFLQKYPPSQAALARIDSEGWGERFEFYWQGFEIANAFHELNDPVAQRLRMKQDLELKKIYGKKQIPTDEIFLKSLEYGLPPTSGVALGMERLFMALHQIKNISDLKFPLFQKITSSDKEATT